MLILRSDPVVEMHWAAASPTSLKFQLAATTTGWLGLGPSSGRMAGSEVVIGHVTGDIEAGNDLTVDPVQAYVLTARTLSGLQVDSNQRISDTKITREDGWTRLEFTRELDNGGQLKLVDNVIMVWAAGASDVIEYHEGLRGIFVWDVSDGVVLGEYSPAHGAHGFLMVIGLAIFVPIGAMMGRYTTHRQPSFGPKAFWFYWHWRVSLIGAVIALVGGIIILAYAQDPAASTHGQFGIALLVMIVVQVLMGASRPQMGTSWRWWFNFAHK